MPNPLRNRCPTLLHHITVKTFADEITLVNYKEINDLIGGILARYQEMLGILIYAFCFNGNHFHLMLQAPNRNIEAFMQYVLREISRRMRRIVSRDADQSFWADRYSDQIVPTEADSIELFLYTSTNAVKHGLEKSMKNYPGFNSLSLQRDGGTQEFDFVHYSKKDGDGNFLKTKHVLRISTLAKFQKDTEKDFLKYLNLIIRERESNIAAARQHKPALGRAYLLLQQPGASPQNERKKKTRPTIYTKSKKVLLEWRYLERERRHRYQKLSRDYRLGKPAIFPDDCYPPARIKIPKRDYLSFAA